MERTKIAALLADPKVGQKYVIKGWVRAFRSNRFIQLNDGSTINNIQAVVDFENFDEQLLKKVTVASAISIEGELVESQGAGQAVELQVEKVEILGKQIRTRFKRQSCNQSVTALNFCESRHIYDSEQTHLEQFLEYAMLFHMLFISTSTTTVFTICIHRS